MSWFSDEGKLKVKLQNIDFYIVYYIQVELRHDKKCSICNAINCHNFDSLCTMIDCMFLLDKKLCNVLTKWLDFKSGLLCFDRVSICRKRYSAFRNVEYLFI